MHPGAHFTGFFYREGDNASRGTLHRLFIGRGTMHPGEHYTRFL
jgi:hypothetical protein